MRALHFGRSASVVLMGAVLGLIALAALSTPAIAANATGWEISSRSVPTNLVPGANGSVDVAVQEIGAGESSSGARWSHSAGRRRRSC